MRRGERSTPSMRGEAEAIESDQAVAAAAKKLDNFGVTRPLRSAESSEARDKLLNFLFWSFQIAK